MDWLVVASVAVVGTLIGSLIYYFIGGPKEYADGSAAVLEQQQAKAEGLKIGAEATNKVVLGRIEMIAARVEEQKKRNPVDVANELLAAREKAGGQKP